MGTVPECALRIRMDFKKQTGASRRYRRPGETGDHLSIAARCPACPPGELHAVRGIEDHRIPGLAEDRKGAKIHYQVIITETDPPLGQEQIRVTRRGGFFQDMGDIPGGKELPFFDIHCARLAGNLSDKVGLPAEKSGNLENVEITGCRIDLLKAMDVGKDR